MYKTSQVHSGLPLPISAVEANDTMLIWMPLNSWWADLDKSELAEF